MTGRINCSRQFSRLECARQALQVDDQNWNAINDESHDLARTHTPKVCSSMLSITKRVVDGARVSVVGGDE